jgi:hypothetical protein
MLPNVRVIAGVDDGFATVPLTPLAVTTDTLVTDPPAPTPGAQDAEMALTEFTAHDAVPNNELVGESPTEGAHDAEIANEEVPNNEPVI